MNVREMSRALVSGTVVYLVMASCSPSAGGPNVANSSDAGVGHGGANGAGAPMTTAGHAPSGTGTSGRGPSMLDAAVDRITNPVPNAEADVYQSGTRIRAKYLVGEDGSRQFEGFRDVNRNEDCGFTPASDGTYRCLPSGALASLYYSDAGCSSPLALVAPATCATQTAPIYASVVTADCGNAKTSIHSVAGQYSGEVYQGDPAACTKTSAAVLSNYLFYSLGAEVSPSEFVKATETVE